MLYVRLYVDCFRRALQGARKSPWTLALPVLYLAILMAAGVLLGGLGIIGGFLVAIAADLCVSSFLYFVGQTVLGSPSRPRELKQSFVAYFWPVVSFGFVVWLAGRILGFALAANPNAELIQLCIFSVAAVLLNAVPEVIYQKSEVHGVAIIAESVRFIQRHWIEWLVPNLVFLGGLYFLVVRVLVHVPGALLVIPLLVGGLVYFLAAFRGNLFHLLDTTSPYQLRNRYASRRE
jgi:hypothetical protein